MSQTKIVLVGGKNSEKTTFLIVFRGDPFPKDYVPSIFENFSMELKKGKKTYQLDIWDAPGQDEFDRLRPLSYQDVNILLLMFNFNDRETFLKLEQWMLEINYFGNDAKIILAGNNADSPVPNVVYKHEIIDFCKKNQINYYVAVDPFTQRGYEKIRQIIMDIADSNDKNNNFRIK